MPVIYGTVIAYSDMVAIVKDKNIVEFDPGIRSDYDTLYYHNFFVVLRISSIYFHKIYCKIS